MKPTPITVREAIHQSLISKGVGDILSRHTETQCKKNLNNLFLQHVQERTVGTGMIGIQDFAKANRRGSQTADEAMKEIAAKIVPAAFERARKINTNNNEK